MRSLFMIILVLITSLAMAQSEESNAIIKRVKSKGELVIGMTGTQPPLSMKSKNGDLIGYEVEIAQMLAQALDVELKIKQMPFAKLLPSVKNGQIDLAMSGVTITSERNLDVAFFGPYLVSGKSLLTKSAILSTITKPSELNSSRYILTTLKGSTGEKYIKDFAPEARVILADNYESAVKLVREGSADAMLADYTVCAFNYFKYAKEGFFVLKTPLTIEPIGVAISPNDPHFMNIIQNFFNTLELTGTLKRLEKYWYDSGDWLSLIE